MSGKKEREAYRRMKYRYFLFAFTVAFLSLSLLLLFLTVMLPPTPRSAAPALEELEEDSFEPSAEDAVSVLFMGTSGEGDIPGVFLLARFDPARGSVPIAVFPPETAVENNGSTESLAEVYQYGGAAYTRDALAAALGVTIDRYVRMDMSAFEACARAVGSVEYLLDRDIQVESGGAPMTMQRGMQLLDGPRAASLLSSRDYEEELDRYGEIGRLAAAIVNQRMDVCKSSLVDQVFQRVINLVDTDITSMDYESRKQAAEHLANRGGEPGLSLTLTGDWGEDGLYHPADTFLALLRQTFS